MEERGTEGGGQCRTLGNSSTYFKETADEQRLGTSVLKLDIRTLAFAK